MHNMLRIYFFASALAEKNVDYMEYLCTEYNVKQVGPCSSKWVRVTTLPSSVFVALAEVSYSECRDVHSSVKSVSIGILFCMAIL